MSSKFTKWYEQTEFNKNNPEEEKKMIELIAYKNDWLNLKDKQILRKIVMNEIQGELKMELEEMRDNFACWIINNNDKKVIAENETTGENKTTIVKDLDIKIGNNFENVMFFSEGIIVSELMLKVDDEIQTYIIK